jgi:hypothetical protein
MKHPLSYTQHEITLLQQQSEQQAARIEALEAALMAEWAARDNRIEALEAALQRITKWVRQNPEANAGDRAGDELLDIVRSIAALAPEQNK